MLRLFLTATALLIAGCSTTREVTITTRPADALITIDGAEHGRAPLTTQLTFRGGDDARTIVASRNGYQDQTLRVTRDTQPRLHIDLEQLQRRITFRVEPIPARVYANGRPITETPVREITADMRFTVDEQENWTRYIVTATHPDFEPAEAVVTWADEQQQYTLQLQPRRKDILIQTEPAGARIAIDGQVVGASPLEISGHPFRFDPRTDEYVPQRITASIPGYPDAEKQIAWDQGQQQYTIQLTPLTKDVRIITDPARPTVEFEDAPDAEVTLTDTGAAMVRLAFPPVDHEGTLRTYTAIVSKRTADSEWYPQRLEIGWDDGRTEYSLALREILTRPVTLLSPLPRRTDDGWQVVAQHTETVAMKDVTEPAAQAPPDHLTPHLPADAFIDSLVVSPNGRDLLYTVLIESADAQLRSQIRLISADGTGGETSLTRGQTLDLSPSFTPDGQQIVFASNRGGRRHTIWSMPLAGAPLAQLTMGDTLDLAPSVDSDPEPRLYYQTHIDIRPDPRLYMTRLNTTRRTDLTHLGGEQPRVSPKADAVLFTRVNESTGKRDIWRTSDAGGAAVNLTDSPDTDDFAPAWSSDASRIAFASDRAEHPETGRNYDIWIMDPANPHQPTQLTSNGSHDDSPAWSPAGDAVYFRSNRGGQWGIWRIGVGIQSPDRE